MCITLYRNTERLNIGKNNQAIQLAINYYIINYYNNR